MGYFFEKNIGMTITNAFKKILKELNGKPNKIWVDKRRKTDQWNHG